MSSHFPRALGLILLGTLVYTSASAQMAPSRSAAFQRLPQILTQFRNSTAAQRNQLLDVKNAKGESIFTHPVPLKEEEGQWALLDPTTDKVQGTSTEQIYQNIPNASEQKEIIVAVIDSGVDIHHLDLQGHLWTNPNDPAEEAKAGFPGDLHGWNFLGNAKGENIGATTLEMTREYARLTKLAASGPLSASDAAYFETVKNEYESKLAAAKNQLNTYEALDAAAKVLLADGLAPADGTLAGMTAYTPKSPEAEKAKETLVEIFTWNPKLLKSFADITKGVNTNREAVNYNYNLNFNSSDLVGDHPEILDEKGYGNPDVIGPDPMHGTHVSGIIAALRNNHFGINGQALNVKIMPIRAVPNGDERDKDVANAIRFAVDHHAQIINMSFGKEFSPNKDYVDQAMQYAAAHNVLLVHAAGNDGENTESYNNYPRKELLQGGEVSTWIEVGASDQTADATLPADFSNYGKTTVDIFAPGVNIVSCLPGKDKDGNENLYGSLSGTSMATPEVAGVAAVLLGLVPNASALELKAAILSKTNQYGDLAIATPGYSRSNPSKPAPLIPFSTLSTTGGTINAYQALDFLKKQK